MGDTSNWEFAASVAAVSIGLGGLLLFTLVAAVGSWRTFERVGDAAAEAAKASVTLQDLARQMALRETVQTAAREAAGPADVEDLRRQTDALIAQQARLQQALRAVIAADALPERGDEGQLAELDAALERLGENIERVSAAVAGLTGR